MENTSQLASTNDEPRSRKSSFKLYDEEDEKNATKAENFRKKCKKEESSGMQ